MSEAQRGPAGDGWDLYVCQIQGLIAAICVDLDLGDVAPDRSRPWLVYVWVTLLDTADGLPSRDEAAALTALEDELQDALCEGLDARYAGRVTTNGRREFYYYASAVDGLRELVDGVLAGFEGWPVDVGAHPDPEWSHYRELLYPNAEERRYLQNRRQCAELQAHGDDLDLPRDVDHELVFAEVRDRERFVADVVQAGFTLVDQWTDDRGHGVRISRCDPVSRDAIDDRVADLALRAVGGVYLGWTTHFVGAADLPEA